MEDHEGGAWRMLRVPDMRNGGQLEGHCDLKNIPKSPKKTENTPFYGPFKNCYNYSNIFTFSKFQCLMDPVFRHFLDCNLAASCELVLLGGPVVEDFIIN